MIAFQILDQRPQVFHDRPKLGRRPGEPAHAHPSGHHQQALAAQHRAESLHPAAPGELRDHYSDECDGEAEPDKEEKEVVARLPAAPGDEAHVVYQHELPAADQRPNRHENGTGRGLEKIARRLCEAAQVGAPQLRRQGGGRDSVAGIRGAKRDGE